MENKHTGDLVEPCYHCFFCKMAKNAKRHWEGTKFWILQVSCSPLSCVTGLSFQRCQVGFYLLARAIGYSPVSPWAIHMVPWSSFFLPHQLGWSQAMLIALVIFLHQCFLSLHCYSSVLWQRKTWCCLNNPCSLCVRKFISTGESGGWLF